MLPHKQINTVVTPDSQKSVKINMFDYPKSINDANWKWRDMLQSNKKSEKSVAFLVSKCVINENIKQIKSISKNYLKFGCPKHDLMQSLLQCGYDTIIDDNIKNYCICNGYSINCSKELYLNIDKYIEIKKLSFNKFGINDESITKETCGSLDIKLNNNNNININNDNISFKTYFNIIIIRCANETFVKKNSSWKIYL